MASMYVLVVAGTTSAVMPVTPLVCVSACPAVLGGSVLVEFSNDGRSNWASWIYGTILAGGSLIPQTNGYVRITATTQNATAYLIDISNGNNPIIDQVVNVNSPMASANVTTEQVLLSFKLPRNYLALNFKMDYLIALSMTNNANVKTMQLRWGGIGGTVLYQSPSLASGLNYNALAMIIGRGDGKSVMGHGAGAAGGAGLSTTAYPTLTTDYVNQETEIVLTVTKATGTDTVQLESCLVNLY